MPRSVTTRRGKPRIETQQEHSTIQTQPRTAKISKLTKTSKSKDESKTELSEKELEKVMWKHVPVSKEDPCKAPIVRSEFSVKYPQNREPYIKLNNAKIKQILLTYGIEYTMIPGNASLQVATTDKTWDPYAIIKARDMIRLIARHVPVEYAQRVLKDEFFSDIIEIAKTSLAANKVRFIKRRARLLGPNGVTLKAIELLTKCYVMVYGKCVCVIGGMRGIREVRTIVEQCMKNIHPIFQLKRLMVLRELEENKDMENESWDRFLPVFKKMNNGGDWRRKRRERVEEIRKLKMMKKKKASKKYTPWPPPPVMSKIDIALESGAYWNKEWRRNNLRRFTPEQKYIIQKEKERNILREKVDVVKKQRRVLKEKKFKEIFSPPEEIRSEVRNNELKTKRFESGNVDVTNLKENVKQIKNNSSGKMKRNVSSLIM